MQPTLKFALATPEMLSEKIFAMVRRAKPEQINKPAFNLNQKLINKIINARDYYEVKEELDFPID